MSDVSYEGEDTSEDLTDEALDDQLQGEAEGEEGEGEEKPEPAKDWAKIAHDKEGKAAAERSKRRAAEARNRELEARLEKLESGKKEPTDAELLKLAESLREDDDDPITDIAALKRFAKTYAAEQRAALEAETQTDTQQRAVNQIVNRMNEAEADFAEDHPDYMDAMKFFRAQRQEEFEELGYAGAVLNRELSMDLLGIVQRALNAGRDPAEAVYNLAKKRGFSATKSVDDVAKKLQTITAGQRAGRGLGSAPASRANNTLTEESVAKLKGAAFDTAWEQLKRQQRRA
jgi:hypothetical protein